LTEDSGDKTVVQWMRSRATIWCWWNEGHRGAGGFKWKKKPRPVVVKGFFIRYSATFSQALKAQQAGTHGGICQGACCLIIPTSIFTATASAQRLPDF